jgi:hypothetical protein
MDKGLSPAWTILQQVYNYVSLLDRAVKQLCNVSIVHVSDSIFPFIVLNNYTNLKPKGRIS